MEEFNTIPSPPRRRKILPLVGLLLVVIFSFGAGYYAGEESGLQKAIGSGQVFGKESDPPAGYLKSDVNFSLFWQVWKLLQEQYVDRPIAETKLFYGALSGLVAGIGDPYTVFLDPKTAADFNQELAGSFEGIGAEIGLRDSQIVIIAPLPGTPAEKAGLKPKDRIIVINGRDTSGMTLESAVAAIRGKRGTEVTLKIIREGISEPFEVKIVRDKISIKSVEFSMKSASDSKQADIAYIKISHFNEDTLSNFSAAVNKALNENPRAIILDLQNNPGGFLETAVDVASYWVANNPVVLQQTHSEERTEFPARGKSPLKGQKTIVLVNAGSASASEIVAGALQDYNLATVIGEKTFGKGSVQELQSLPDGSAVKITVAKWFTPKGRSIEGEGIEPDIVVTVDRAKLDDGKDPVLERALELLK
ncbi:hypothetical protein A3H10_01905 [Candidatus Uhrbacteria bacterium RIFCSPLOWO2_12_FULL_46_10]|uniref:PDZ domain-containing protein n=1 Tax=Candidatus Uhrbacteria bacterium RIFCSPLOWO2_01_FULL_47_25 TaxID=1802402 RepID=A0A1F7UPL0_9BACT|nr:MAG: hypothetical protein A2752_00590 [Candidatus Uhrbacteria bacterium RIFCSPHIGHO2_01_FULL_46_23]OGL69190.1 MAG: hypothetical protein A3D60_04795 [Candidatus Uhrbacteria bacterium RIFCSPHIGHO2_02_FULL_47_29]OGL75308.1 MAG: hypothetical protein A3E96_01415 [Candidatus Uhrbacteria bacterium RIFCSPHIGHO2_12_FULL_46_13]OGL80253.1 MAG: hypothetical protein A2936_02700 [Candidatus Uhrbacteria bacterium RIFCSPLOWO2_01_FULL_47_25]OGL85328.1 MAG: hypothetical protein A3I37_00605 [Candidatus Uhrbact